MPILGKNALDDASLFIGDRNGVTLNAPLKVIGDITATGTLVPAGDIELEFGNKIRGFNVAGTTLLDLIYNGTSNETHINGSTKLDFDINGTTEATLTAAALTLVHAGIVLSALGKTLTLKNGSNAKAGTFTLNGATPVSVATTSFIAGSTVAISLKTVGGTVGVQPHLATATAGTGFTVVGTASDTSIYNWAIIDQA